MFTLSKATEYAILFLASLARKNKDEPVNLKEIIKETDLPYKFLSRIVLELKKNGLINSKEGSGGGYFLTKEPEKINLKEIIEAVEGEKGLVSCIHGRCLMEKSCLHKKVWLKLQNILNEEFKKITLAKLS